jgi:hypothetical protein
MAEAGFYDYQIHRLAAEKELVPDYNPYLGVLRLTKKRTDERVASISVVLFYNRQINKRNIVLIPVDTKNWCTFRRNPVKGILIGPRDSNSDGMPFLIRTDVGHNLKVISSTSFTGIGAASG